MNIKAIISQIISGFIGAIAVVMFLVITGMLPARGSNANISEESGANRLSSQAAELSSGTGSLVPVLDGASSFTQDELNNIHIYELRNEAVVNVSTETVSYSLFFEPVPTEGGTGSGSIIDSRGYVLTNVHVIENAVKVYVTLSDGDRLEAQVVGIDPENDLAVLKFDPGDRVLTTIPLGESDNLEVGQKVLAIGNPFSFDRTLTTGVVSGLGRPIQNSNGTIIQGMIQTDASINPGNSGGPLLDSHGYLIGVNTMIYSVNGGSVGVGFAVPADTAKRVVPDLIDFGRVNRGWIDITPIQLFSELVEYADLPVDAGILISSLEDAGQAAAAGLQAGSRSRAVRYGRTIIYLGGDIIVEVDGTPTASIAQLYEALEDNSPGETVEIVYYRNGRRRTTEVQLVERPQTYSLN